MPEADDWDGYGSQLELVAAMLYNARANSSREMTPERWSNICNNFPASARMCREDADDEIADL